MGAEHHQAGKKSDATKNVEHVARLTYINGRRDAFNEAADDCGKRAAEYSRRYATDGNDADATAALEAGNLEKRFRAKAVAAAGLAKALEERACVHGRADCVAQGGCAPDRWCRARGV